MSGQPLDFFEQLGDLSCNVLRNMGGQILGYNSSLGKSYGFSWQVTMSVKTRSLNQQSSQILTILQRRLLLRISKVVRGDSGHCISIYLFHYVLPFPKFCNHPWSLAIRRLPSINEIRAFAQFFVFYILFSLQRLHLLLIITFKAKRLKSKIDFSKKRDLYNSIYFEICDDTVTTKNGGPRNEHTPCVLRRFISLTKVHQVILLVCARSLYVSQIVKDDTSQCKVQYWVRDPIISSQVMVHL